MTERAARSARVLSVVGARPNLVKIAPVLARLREHAPAIESLLVHTGQHYDHEMSDVFFNELGIPPPAHNLGIGPASHASQTAAVIAALEPLVTTLRPDIVVVAGDVTSTLASAIAAVQTGFAVAHVESGLRSFDRTMPEEINRVVVDHLATLLFTHSPDANDNLRHEGIAASSIHYVGNTMIDSLIAMEPVFRRRDACRDYEVAQGDFILTTLHRPATVDGPLLVDVVEALEALSAVVPVIFPVHPRTRARLAAAGWRPQRQALRITPPLGYVDFLSLLSDSFAVVTDSGGIQEEATCLAVPCFTFRENTERPITLTQGSNTLLGLDPSRLADVPELARAFRAAGGCGRPPLWDGQAGARAVDTLIRWLNDSCDV